MAISSLEKENLKISEKLAPPPTRAVDRKIPHVRDRVNVAFYGIFEIIIDVVLDIIIKFFWSLVVKIFS